MFEIGRSTRSARTSMARIAELRRALMIDEAPSPSRRFMGALRRAAPSLPLVALLLVCAGLALADLTTIVFLPDAQVVIVQKAGTLEVKSAAKVPTLESERLATIRGARRHAAWPRLSFHALCVALALFALRCRRRHVERTV